MRPGQTKSVAQEIQHILLSTPIAIKVFADAILAMLLLWKKIFVITVHYQWFGIMPSRNVKKTPVLQMIAIHLASVAPAMISR